MSANEVISVDVAVAGGGPAGVMAGLLFARAGCRTLVLEKHADFLRDFRGDTVHPSTLEVMHELGLLEEFLKRPHARVEKLGGVIGGEPFELTDFSSIDAKCKFIAMMPQWDFLDFLSNAARGLPTFDMRMQAEATELIVDDGRVAGIKVKMPDRLIEVGAKLTIAADGRHSTLRDQSGLKVTDIGAPIDVLWFAVPRTSRDLHEPLLNAGPGHIVITLDRGDYYQCAFVIEKGGADATRQRGIEAFRAIVTRTAPKLKAGIGAVKSFDDVKLLTVKIDRLEKWSRPGLLVIGDAAHAMSPVGGVGINLAIQDAVAAANILAAPLADGTLTDDDLGKVRDRRMWPTRATQFAQVQAQKHIVMPLMDSDDGDPPKPPLPVRIITNIPWLQRQAAHYIGMGVRPEHVRSPAAYDVRPPTDRHQDSS